MYWIVGEPLAGSREGLNPSPTTASIDRTKDPRPKSVIILIIVLWKLAAEGDIEDHLFFTAHHGQRGVKLVVFIKECLEELEVIVILGVDLKE